MCQDPQRLVLLSRPFPLLYQILLHHFVHDKGPWAPSALHEVANATFQDIELLLNVKTTSLVHLESNLVLSRISELAHDLSIFDRCRKRTRASVEKVVDKAEAVSLSDFLSSC